MRSQSLLPRVALLAAVLAGASHAVPAAAQAPPLMLALELQAANTIKGDPFASESVTRQVATHLTAALEAEGWKVVRVHDFEDAASSGRFHAVVYAYIDARPIYHLRDARQYADQAGKTVVTDYSKSVETWGRWQVWDGMTGKRILKGKIEPIVPQVQGKGAGSPELDDEASMARLMADATHKAVAGALVAAQATQP